MVVEKDEYRPLIILNLFCLRFCYVAGKKCDRLSNAFRSDGKQGTKKGVSDCHVKNDQESVGYVILVTLV